MGIKLKLSSDSIYLKSFQPVRTGYDCKEVDQYLDSIIQDYETIESYLASDDSDLAQAKIENQKLQERITKLEAENSLLKENTQGGLSLNGASNNLELLKRISRLEKTLKNAGIDPNKVK